MKKLLLLALIVLSCLAFASCDAVQQFVPGLDFGGIGNKADITEEEWLELVSETNYSSNYTFYENQDGELVATVNFERKFDNTTSYVKRIENGEISFEEYITVMDNNGYSIIDNNYSDGFILSPSGSIPEPTPLMSEGHAKRCYQYLKEKNENTYTIKYNSSDYYTLEYVIEHQDGKIVSMTETYTHKNGDDKLETKFFDIGTTVIELPEFTYADDNNDSEEVRTTITEDEWDEFVALNNFSYTLSYGDVQMTLKMTESAYCMQQNEYYNIVVLIDDVLYTLQPYGEDRYFAYEYTESSPLSNIGNMLPVSYDALVYDAETKSYTAQGEGETYVFYFENGKIVAGEIVMPAPDGSEVKGILYDFGTTVLNFENVLLPNQ